MKTAEQVLRGAAKRVRKGWFQGGSGTEDESRVCVARAVGIEAYSAGGIALFQDALRFLEQVIGNAVEFNDDPATTKRDVIAALEIAADLAAPPYDAGADVPAGG